MHKSGNGFITGGVLCEFCEYYLAVRHMRSGLAEVQGGDDDAPWWGFSSGGAVIGHKKGFFVEII